MSDLKFNPINRPSLARKSGAPGLTRTLQNANKEALHLLGQAMDTPGDPKGRVLRQLRLQMGIDPSILATQACMSLSQLYELEEGGISLFYSDSLRRQAGRRVAHLLGADWDSLALEEREKPHPTASNVVPLQRTAVVTPAASIAPAHVQTPQALPQSITMSADEPSQTSTANESHAVHMGLTTPAIETLLVEPPTLPLITTEIHAQEKASGWGGVIMTLLFIMAAGAAGAYAFVEYSPYRLYWPW
jgi:hypothetical protein